MTKNYQPPENNKISLYNLDEEWLEKTKQRYRLYQKKEYEQRLQQMYRKRDAWMDFFRQRIRAGHDASDVRQEITKQDAEIKQLKRRIEFMSMPKSKAKEIDIQAAKAIPIDSLYEVLPNGFFVNNPLRKERSPSNSFHLNRNTNRWNDYATGEYGDLLDLVMKENNCDLITAYKKII